jgi:class 3 adenylate cyclase
MPEQERRLITILFADVLGSTALGASLDPEELYELVDRVHTQVEACVLRYGGHLARHLAMA